VDKRVLTVEQLREEHIRVILELRQNREDEVSFGMAPPRAAKRFTREDADHVWECFVLREKKALVGEGCENRISGPHNVTLPPPPNG
jgi:hypothetical protein